MLTSLTAERTCATTSGRSRKVVGPKNALSTGRISNGPIPPRQRAIRSKIANWTF